MEALEKFVFSVGSLYNFVSFTETEVVFYSTQHQDVNKAAWLSAK